MAKGKRRDTREEASRLESEQDKLLGPVLKEVEKQKAVAEREDLNFSSPTPDQLRRKLGSRNSPFVDWQSWNSSASPGGTINYNVGIYNPDPTATVWLFGFVFVGPANLIPDVGDALGTIDAHFPTLVQPPFAGLNIPATTQSSLSYALPVPPGTPSTNYLGNTFIFQSNWHDVGTYFDRGIFVFQVT